MRIAIDARLNAYRQGGIPQYTRQLLTALADVARDDHQFISLQHREHLRPLAVAPNVARRTVLTPPHHRYEPWAFPLEVLLAWPDVLHCPDFIAPVHRPCPAVVTIHDLAFLHYPELLEETAREYYSQVKSNAARADAIIAVSETTRQDIAQFLDIPIEEIAVIHEAAAPLYGSIELRDGEARVLGSTPVAADTFMLFVSTLEPRKNLSMLLQALRICLDRRPDRTYRLVVAGSRGWRDELIFQAARDLRLGDHVLFVGPVGQYDLRWLYNACRVYINPSLYEGFGLPLMEAMACGAACLAAATSSLPEIGGNAALYIPPLDPGLWADAIEALWDDQERRAELGRLGCAQAQRFSWKRAARETLKVYQQVAERAHRHAAPAYASSGARDEAYAATEGNTPPVAADKRTCLRCGTPMLSSQLERGILVAEAASSEDSRSQTVLAWLCPRCGHVELVVGREALEVAPATVVVDEDAADVMEQPDAPELIGDPIALEASAGGEAAVEASAAAPEPDASSIEVPGLSADAVGSDSEVISSAHDDTPRAAITQVFEIPVDLAQPADTSIATEDTAAASSAATPAETAASQARPGRRPRTRTTKNGTDPNHTQPADLADPPVAPGQAALPKKPRQSRSKRKRST
ncbi:MAG TPA: glycosyltransferase family 1 protein [Roseiflexaceae bacterium]|nr:glycosyltransferase family 1 protein [Roseiflexaceae bacterium]